MTHNIVTSGDKELWLITIGDKRLPIHATPCLVDSRSGYYKVTEPCVFTAEQELLLIDFLRAPSLVDRARYYFWLVPAKTLDGFAAKAPGVTPEYYIVWPSPEPALQPPVDDATQVEARPALPEADDDFIRWLFQRTACCDLPTLRLVWESVRQQSLYWLFIEGRQFDLGWCLLTAMPYRANWKQAILASEKWQNIGAILKRHTWRNELTLLGFETVLSNTALSAVQKSDDDGAQHRFTWTIEVTPTPHWYDYTNRHEADTLASVGPSQYILRWLAHIRRHTERTLAIFRAFTAQTAIAMGSVVRCGNSCARRLVPYIPPGRVTSKAEFFDRFCLVSPDGSDTEPLTALGPPPVEFTVDGLSQELPVLRLATKNVRDAEPVQCLPESTNPSP